MSKALEIHEGQAAAIEGARWVFEKLHGPERQKEFWVRCLIDVEEEIPVDPARNGWLKSFHVRLWNDWEEREIDLRVVVRRELDEVHSRLSDCWYPDSTYTWGLGAAGSTEEKEKKEDDAHPEWFEFPSEFYRRTFNLGLVEPVGTVDHKIKEAMSARGKSSPSA